MDYIFVKFFGFGLGLVLDCFWSQSRTLGLKIFRSCKNYRVSVSTFVQDRKILRPKDLHNSLAM